MLTNHEIVVRTQDQLKGALDFLLQKGEFFRGDLFKFEDRINFYTYADFDLSLSDFSCIQMIKRLGYSGKVFIDFTMTFPDYKKHEALYTTLAKQYPEHIQRLVIPGKHLLQINS